MIRMKDARLLLGLSQVQVTDRMAEHGIEMSVGGLSNIENGNKKASDRVLIAWAKALGIDPLNVWHGPLRAPVQPATPPRRRSEQVPA
jgi:transcriptional regulator with XRE-family HTH domain